MTIPKSFVEQNLPQAGSSLAVEIHGSELRLRPNRVRPTLDEQLSATPHGAHRVGGWDTLPAGRNEL